MPEGRRDGYDGGQAPEGPPDAGLAAIAARFGAAVGVGAPGAAAGVPGPAAPAGPGPEDIWPLRLAPQQTTAAGTVDFGEEWGPPTGRAWRIFSMNIMLGTGATLCQVYRNAAQLVNLRFQTSVSGLWEPSMEMLLAGERLVVVFTGGGGTVAVHNGDQISYGWLPRYLL